ncbi:hypothetical protein [Clostridium oceanicum]|uniref:Lipoprotein n=1 Tax=Clostridium oceanicum TaxID=1543 RepID=A0ABN1JER8_9CLOT
MKRNGYFIIKKIVSVLIIGISITTFFGCSKGKSIVLQDDVKKANKSFEGNIKVDEKFIYMNENEAGRIFWPSFWQNGKLFGTLIYSFKKEEELGIENYIPKYFHALDVNKKVLKQTKKKAFASNHFGLKEVSSLPKQNCNVYYNDFSKEKSKNNIILRNVNSCYSPLDTWWGLVGMVDGNDNFANIYEYDSSKNIAGIELIDLQTKKIYTNNNVGDIKIVKILYVRDLKKFMVIDKNGVCYEIKFKKNDLELKKYSKIDTGDLTLEQPIFGVSCICDDSVIYFISRNRMGKNKLIKNRLIKYDFKTKKTNFILNTDEKDKTRVLMYFPKQNILILEKSDISKDGLEKKGPSDIYIAEIKKGKVNIFYKSKYKNEENKYSKTLIEKLGYKNKDGNYIKNNDDDMRIRINDKGDKLAITRNINIFHKNINKNTYKSIEKQVIDYYQIKRD